MVLNETISVAPPDAPDFRMQPAQKILEVTSVAEEPSVQVDHAEFARRLKRLSDQEVHIELSPAYFELTDTPIDPIFVKLPTPADPHPKVATTIFPIPSDLVKTAAECGRSLALTIGRRSREQIGMKTQWTNINLIVPDSIFTEIEQGERSIINPSTTAPLNQDALRYVAAQMQTYQELKTIPLWRYASAIQGVLAVTPDDVSIMDLSGNGTYPYMAPATIKDLGYEQYEHHLISYVRFPPGAMVRLDPGHIDGKTGFLTDEGALCLGCPGANVVQVVELPPEYTNGAARFGIVDGEAPQVTGQVS